jgi:hypothetical protein
VAFPFLLPVVVLVNQPVTTTTNQEQTNNRNEQGSFHPPDPSDQSLWYQWEKKF